MKHYSAERKAAVLQKMLPPISLSVAELAKQEGISDVTLYHWRKQAMASGAMSAVTKKTAEGWSGESKLAAVVETALLSEVELSEYCREKGLYPDQVKAWKQACIVGQQTATQQKQTAGAQTRADQKRIRELERELHRKDKALAEAAAILILRKKLNALWGDDTGEN
ncbi:transposase IS3/IS911 family protein [Acidithiobacillus ferrivorans SS3]|uniref:Transposase IS3/IS911 family protein n=1 Tax=Acidithiobacillus ferrivorans SS3 TaxID=743299 RepID=G0JN13_9PROT|nr:transposase IS3/IS911 family protein [Acidithiobacillus ferrivorans SS3]OFA15610.1 transposase [Acidithiobacillus ferrivorans]